MSQHWVLIDQDTGLHVGWYFWLRVLDEVNRSARYGAPFGLLLLEAEGDDHDAKRALSALPGAIRGTDLGGRLGTQRAGVVLMNQDAAGARTATERVLERLASAHPHGRWATQLLTYPDDGGEISMLLTTGWAPAEAPIRRPA